MAKGPTPKAKKAYNKLIEKSYERLDKVMKKHNPEARNRIIGKK